MNSNNKNQIIRFDWAMKRLLRNKANFSVLEGLLTTLLGEKIIIQRLLESESNQEDEYDKYNRVDMLAENSKGELVLIEVQNNNEYAYFQRMLFGTSKLVTEYINRGESYDKVRKVYSVNIVYFSLGHGRDFVYHGKTEFRGIHTNDLLELTPFQKQTFKVDTVSQLYPEYYILKVNGFNQVAKSPLEEWIYYLNTGEIPSTATAPGLEEARERLKLDSMTKDELAAYYRHLDNIVILRDNINTEREEGRAEGLEEGERKKAIEVARYLKSSGTAMELIIGATIVPSKSTAIIIPYIFENSLIRCSSASLHISRVPSFSAMIYPSSPCITACFKCGVCTMQLLHSYNRTFSPTTALFRSSLGSKECNEPQLPRSDHPNSAGNT